VCWQLVYVRRMQAMPQRTPRIWYFEDGPGIDARSETRRLVMVHPKLELTGRAINQRVEMIWRGRALQRWGSRPGGGGQDHTGAQICCDTVVRVLSSKMHAIVWSAEYTLTLPLTFNTAPHMPS
jgi:hypothetical protein